MVLSRFKTRFAMVGILSILSCFYLVNFSWAASEDVGAFLEARHAVSLSNVQNMNFGIVEFTAVHSGDIRLATNGVIALYNAVGLVLSGVAAAGSVDISGDVSEAMEISCETLATLTDGIGNSLTADSLEIATGAGIGFGLGTACAGISISPLVSIGATVVKIGGRINVDGSILYAGDYDTSNAGGDPVTIQVVYQ